MVQKESGVRKNIGNVTETQKEILRRFKRKEGGKPQTSSENGKLSSKSRLYVNKRGCKFHTNSEPRIPAQLMRIKSQPSKGVLWIVTQIVHVWGGTKLRWHICFIPHPKSAVVEPGLFLWCNRAKENNISQVQRPAPC